MDVRLVMATHRDLEAAVTSGAFREDLYYRVSWVTLDLPPLRARREDISLLVEHFRHDANRDYGLDVSGVSDAAMAIIEADHWPGSVRELEAVIKPAMIRRHSGRVMPEDLVLPKLRRDRVSAAMRTMGIALTPAQAEALRLASIQGQVRRGDLVMRCRISREAARRALVGLERAGALRRRGTGRGARYVTIP